MWIFHVRISLLHELRRQLQLPCFRSAQWRRAALTLELILHCNFWAFCNVTGFESSSAAGLMYTPVLTSITIWRWCALRRTEAPTSCSLWYKPGSVSEAESKNSLSLCSGVNVILYGHRQNDVCTLWASTPRLTQSVKPLLFPSSIIGVTKVMIIHASVQCVLPAACWTIWCLLCCKGLKDLFCNVSSSLSFLTGKAHTRTHTENLQSF